MAAFKADEIFSHAQKTMWSLTQSYGLLRRIRRITPFILIVAS